MSVINTKRVFHQLFRSEPWLNFFLNPNFLFYFFTNPNFLFPFFTNPNFLFLFNITIFSVIQSNDTLFEYSTVENLIFFLLGKKTIFLDQFCRFSRGPQWAKSWNIMPKYKNEKKIAIPLRYVVKTESISLSGHH